jgi:hypothetical protein
MRSENSIRSVPEIRLGRGSSGRLPRAVSRQIGVDCHLHVSTLWERPAKPAARSSLRLGLSSLVLSFTFPALYSSGSAAGPLRVGAQAWLGHIAISGFRGDRTKWKLAGLLGELRQRPPIQGCLWGCF